MSIITPTYNHEKFIGPCIESVLKQTYQNWEQIIIDDGSTDRTRDVVESYSDERIRYYRQKNRGIEALAHAYNTALQHARGVLVAILEGDDLWPPYKLSTQVPPFANADIVLNYGVVGEVSVDGVQRETLARSVRTRMRLAKAILFNDPVRSATRYMLRADGVDLVPPSTVVIRRSALQCIGGFQYVPGLYVTDYPTFLWLSLQGKFHYTQELVGYRRRHLGSATLQNLDLIISGAEAYAVQFASQHRLRLDDAEKRALQKTWQRTVYLQSFTKGRLALLARQWGQARSHFLSALDPRDPLVFFAAMAGIVSSWFRTDLERLISLTGLSKIRENEPHEVSQSIS